MIKDIFSFYIKGILNKEKGSEERILKAGKIFSKYLTQIKTTSGNNGKKVKKIPYIIDDIVPEIALFLSYKSLREYMAINSRFKSLIDNDSFWKRKFKSEFKYEYPKIIENNLKKGWKYATIEFLNMKDKIQDLFKKKILTKSGNELLLITAIKNVNLKYSILRNWIRFYIKNNNKLNDQLLIDLINYNVDFFKVISLYPKKREYNKKRAFLEYLKKLRDEMWDEEIDEFLMKLYNFEEFKDIFSNEEFLLKAVKVNGIILKYLIFLNKNYSKNKQLILEALESIHTIFKHVNLDLQDDRDFVLKAVEINGDVLEYLSPKFKDDKDIVVKAIEDSFSSFEYVSERLRDSDDIAVELILEHPHFIKFAGPKIKNDVNIFYKIVKYRSDLQFLEYAGEKVKKNFKFAMYAISISRRAIYYFPIVFSMGLFFWT